MGLCNVVRTAGIKLGDSLSMQLFHRVMVAVVQSLVYCVALAQTISEGPCEASFACKVGGFG